MLGEIKKLRENAVDQDTIGQMAGFFLTTYYLKEETNAAQAAELAQYELIGGGWRNALEFLNRIQKVTPADVQAAANKYMKNLRFVVVGNPADINRSIFLQN
jgi:predicted Zn-dependent peptidase